MLHCGVQCEVQKANLILQTSPPVNTYIWNYKMAYRVIQAKPGHCQASVQAWPLENKSLTGKLVSKQKQNVGPTSSFGCPLSQQYWELSWLPGHMQLASSTAACSLYWKVPLSPRRADVSHGLMPPGWHASWVLVEENVKSFIFCCHLFIEWMHSGC